MHDTILLNKISQGLSECCKTQKISKINELTVAVNKKSHVNSENLTDYLKNYNKALVSSSLKIKVEIEDLPDQTAMIRRLEGEVAEN
ncbi:Zn finger protein HypA/HybF involved in hydrogenase expression [Clostridium acetobutylicum]|uniref:Uncharacterized protein n=2 Tax=Clostridium acetobutylicum TaxID=1488 RepID=Q7DFM7_CLOAB|nr:MULTISPECIES: hypothetical protein [Clostridium]AAK11586.1 HypQ4 [Clostridium acetobutylicum ATCC 824]AAK76890.1 Hypothetical protein, CF-29 family [Clostridium acetobutylicum ATCC 824]ADZ22927.1 Hypothetical protein, CF-29 family [Clostridium acetobutylicum EA 2018]AEI34886.1 hypothetical protein SMB_P143 [Clostridium acetobutylicum DSM 1731]AWV82432.1 hypothetical protein DK921_20285 [Clostridium acetobutylicum]